jgi:hypothetical protein
LSSTPRALALKSLLPSIPTGTVLEPDVWIDFDRLLVPGTLPAAGFDTIIAVDRALDPTVIGTDAYTCG